MLLKKFCFFFCAIFLLESLYHVIENSLSVQYVKKSHNNKILNFSFCIKLDQELLLNFKKPSDNLYLFTVKELLESTCNNFFSNSTCYSSIDLSNSYLFNYHSCLIFEYENFDTLIRKLNNTNFKIFTFFNFLSEVHFYESIFSNTAKLEPFTLKLDYIEYELLESPYETNCYHYSNKNINFRTKEKVFGKPSCTYNCIAAKSRSLNYYYSSRDDEPLILYEKDLNNSKKWTNLDENLEIDHANKCLYECKKTGNILRLYFVNEFNNKDQLKYDIIYHTLDFSARPSTIKIQSIINFVSLIVLFLNISFYETVPYLIKNILSNHLKKYKTLFDKYYWIVKLVILILCLLFIIFLSLLRIFDYWKNDYNELMGYNFPNENSPFYLMICVPVQILIEKHSKLNEEKEINLLLTKSFTELENLTDFNVFESKIERIFIQYASEEKKIDYSIDKTKIAFRYFDYEFENYKMSNFLLRCYKIDLNIEELKYEMLYSLSKLKIILKFNWYIIYPIPENFNLTNATLNLIFDPLLFKKLFRKKFNCFDYSKNKSFSNLSDKENAIDQCVNEKHLKNYGYLPVQSVIYKNTIPAVHKLEQIYFNQSIERNILDECRNIFKTQNCFYEYFDINKLKPLNQINETFNMNLYYPEYLIIDDIILSLSDLLLNNLLSFESIFIGLNIGKILSILFILLKRYKLNKILKYYSYLKFVILLIGLSIHIYYIIDDILNSEHILKTDYFISKSIQLPNLIFCFEIQNYNEIDFNYRQTSKYLDDYTGNINLNFFKNFSFLNNNLNKTFFLPNQNETFNELDKINKIYFLNLKCYEFVFKSVDIKDYYYTFSDVNFISLKFNKEILLEYFKNPNFSFYLITRKKLTNELNGIQHFNFNYDNNNHPLIKIYQKSNILKVKEKFHNLLSILYNSVNLDDTTEYINKLLDDLKKLNFKTKRIIMNLNDSNYQYENEEIDDEMFDQYFSQIKNVTDYNSFKIFKLYEREIYYTKFVESHSKNDENYDMYFYLHPVQAISLYTNRDNYSKFVISILNCLNIWLNFCCLDFYVYLNKLCNLIYKFYQIVLSFKFYLKQKKSQMLM